MALCALAGLLITVLIVGVCLYLLWWGLQGAPIPAPFQWVVKLIFAIICVVALLEVLSGKLEIGQRLLGNC